MSDDRIIKVIEPRREWLLYHQGEKDELFSLWVTSGAVEIFVHKQGDLLRLERTQIAEFRQALDEAIDIAEQDLQAHRV